MERRAVFDLEKAQARAHILEGLVKAQDRIDDVVAVGKASASREQFEAVLRGDETMAGIAVFDFSEAQAKAIAERRLYQLSRLDVNKVQDEHEELKLVIADLEDILSSRPRRLTILKEELAEVVDRHGDERAPRSVGGRGQGDRGQDGAAEHRGEQDGQDKMDGRTDTDRTSLIDRTDWKD